jgi:hypothetical protein
MGVVDLEVRFETVFFSLISIFHLPFDPQGSVRPYQKLPRRGRTISHFYQRSKGKRGLRQQTLENIAITSTTSGTRTILSANGIKERVVTKIDLQLMPLAMAFV